MAATAWSIASYAMVLKRLLMMLGLTRREIRPPSVLHTFVYSGAGPQRQIDTHANDRFVMV